MKKRPAGSVRLRWFGESRVTEFKRMRVATALAKAMPKWFRSNNSPDAFVMAMVIERTEHE